jgi:uncharacterized protein YndB with AHSA1/START domain
MTDTAVAQAQDVIVLETQIAAPPERVFQAITDPDEVEKWWGQKGNYRTNRRTGEVKVGSKWRTEGTSATGEPFSVEGEYLEIDPPRLLVHTWVASFGGFIPTSVRWELTPSAGGTLLKLTHSGFAGKPEAFKGHYQGWTRVLGWMQAFVERGETVDSRPAEAAKP